jgi:hypothetical protein
VTSCEPSHTCFSSLRQASPAVRSHLSSLSLYRNTTTSTPQIATSINPTLRRQNQDDAAAGNDRTGSNRKQDCILTCSCLLITANHMFALNSVNLFLSYRLVTARVENITLHMQDTLHLFLSYCSGNCTIRSVMICSRIDLRFTSFTRFVFHFCRWKI